MTTTAMSNDFVAPSAATPHVLLVPVGDFERVDMGQLPSLGRTFLSRASAFCVATPSLTTSVGRLSVGPRLAMRLMETP
jgi:hypothetical protein